MKTSLIIRIVGTQKGRSAGPPFRPKKGRQAAIDEHSYFLFVAVRTGLAVQKLSMPSVGLSRTVLSSIGVNYDLHPERSVVDNS